MCLKIIFKTLCVEDNSDDSDDDDDLSFSKRTGNYMKNSKLLPKNVLGFRRCTDLNKENPSRVSYVVNKH